MRTKTKGLAQSRPRRLQIHRGRRCNRGKRSEAAQTQGGERAECRRPGPPCQGCHPGPLRDGWSLEGAETRREDPSRADKRGSQQQARREPLNHPRRCKSSAEEERGPTSLRQGSRQARRGATTLRKGPVGAESSGHAPGARGGDPQSGSLLEIPGRGPILSHPPSSGRVENEIAVGESTAAGEVRGGRQEERRAQPPSPRGNGSCWCCACGVLCRWGQPWCSRGTAWREKCLPSTH